MIKFSKDIKNLIKKFAPTIAAAMGGPVAGTAAQFLSKQLLGKSDSSPIEIEQYLFNASPETLADLKKLDYDFNKKMAELDIDVYKIEVDDRKSARDLAKINMIPQVLLSVIFIGGYFFILYLLFSGHVILNENIKDMGNILLGVMTANIPQIMSFWFGSSHGSKLKNNSIN